MIDLIIVKLTNNDGFGGDKFFINLIDVTLHEEEKSVN
jgi:hypothetical protein